MPVISLQIGEINKEQKKALIQQLTQVAAEITQIPKESFIVMLHELGDENIGVGGADVVEIKERRKNK